MIRALALLADLLRVLAGYAAYRITGRTSGWAYRSLRRLHARTDGRFNDAWLALARRLRPHRAAPVRGFLGDWTAAQLEAVAATLERDGIALLDRKLPESQCRELERYARTVPCLPMGRGAREVYAPETAQALRYDFDLTELLQQPTARSIARDGTCEAITAAYFRTAPEFDFLTMWWTTAKGERDYSKAAQKFHYDMDRPFFLKFFVYLTDVGERNGPHTFVAGSHRRKPPALRRDGRFEDAEVLACYPPEQVRRVTGPRGTVFVADTRGLHKGEPVVEGDRLVLQVEYALNRFGQNY